MTSWAETIAGLFVAHRASLESMVTRRVRSRDAAADIVQEVFARVLKAGSVGSPEGDRRFLFAAARNAAVDHGRMTRRRSACLASVLPEQIVAGEPSCHGALEARQALTALDRALEELSPRSRAIFILHRVHGMPNAIIAKRFGITVSAVEKQLGRVLRHCQRRLADHLDRP